VALHKVLLANSTTAHLQGCTVPTCSRGIQLIACVERVRQNWTQENSYQQTYIGIIGNFVVSTGHLISPTLSDNKLCVYGFEFRGGPSALHSALVLEYSTRDNLQLRCLFTRHLSDITSDRTEYARLDQHWCTCACSRSCDGMGIDRKAYIWVTPWPTHFMRSATI